MDLSGRPEVMEPAWVLRLAEKEVLCIALLHAAQEEQGLSHFALEEGLRRARRRKTWLQRLCLRNCRAVWLWGEVMFHCRKARTVLRL